MTLSAVTRSRRALTALPVAALTALSLAVPGSALAAQVDCGDVITKSTTLSADVVCQPGDAGAVARDGKRYALLVGANHVKLNLAGHSVEVPFRFAGGEFDGSVGVYGRHHVTIANGRLAETVLLRSSHHNRLHHLRVDGFIGGVVLDASRANRISHADVSGDQGSSVLLQNGSHRNVVAWSNLHADNGLQLLDSDRNVIKHNRSCSSVVPINVLRGSDRNLIRRNDVSCGGFMANIQVVEGARRNILVENLANSHPDGDGILVSDPSTVLIGNTANANSQLGINAVQGVDGWGNRASGNGNSLQCAGVVCS
ncbi:MAG TPA: NosD domain-containing protein [Thermoleophilaceae bacterium]|nr:NosD domain-containing protein [Thermoleophilaceae bacterium]